MRKVFAVVALICLLVLTSCNADQTYNTSKPGKVIEVGVVEKPKVMVEIESEPEIEVEVEPEREVIVFRCTAYCNCSTCCGKWAGGPTASGTMPKAGRTIAVDTRVIPFGTEVVINGHTYIAEDTGSAIKGHRIDIYFDTHSEAMNFGVQYLEVEVTW